MMSDDSNGLSIEWNQHRFEDGLELLREIKRMGFSLSTLPPTFPEHLKAGILKATQKIHMRVIGVSSPSLDEDLKWSWEQPRQVNFDLLRVRVLARMDFAVAVGAQFYFLDLGPFSQHDVVATLLRMAATGRAYSRKFVRAKIDWLLARKAWMEEKSGPLRNWWLWQNQQARHRGLKPVLILNADLRRCPLPHELESFLALDPALKETFVWPDLGCLALLDQLSFLDLADCAPMIGPRSVGYFLHRNLWLNQELQLPQASDWASWLPFIHYLSKDAPLIWRVQPRIRRLHVTEALENLRQTTAPGQIEVVDS